MVFSYFLVLVVSAAGLTISRVFMIFGYENVELRFGSLESIQTPDVETSLPSHQGRRSSSILAQDVDAADP